MSPAIQIGLTPDNVQLSRVTRPYCGARPQPRLVPRQLKLIDTGTLDQNLDALAAQKQRAANTTRAYAADLRDFHGFCQQADTAPCPCPATPQTVCQYLMYEANQGLTVATITRRLVSITSEHKAAGHPTPCNAQVGDVLLAIRRKLGCAPKPKTPISAENLKTMIGAMDDDICSWRDRAILVVGFGSGCRRGELAALELADVATVPEGLVIHIAKSKTDQEAKGREVGVQRGQYEETCPVRVLARWILERGSWPGPLFCRVGPHTGKITHQRLAPAAIAAAVKAAAKRAGLQPDLYAGHSLRSGCATSASAAGADILAIARRLGHASSRSTERYVRHGSIFAQNPLAGVL